VPGLFVDEHPGPGPLVVLVHGSMDRSLSFAKVVRQLGDLHVVAYDRQGYGRSDHGPPRTSVAGHVADLVDVLAGRRGVVIGHSYGGDVALAAAVARPDLVAAVGAFEAPLPWQDWWPGRSAGGAAMDARSPEEAAEAFMRRIVGDHVWSRLPPSTREKRRSEGAALVSDLESIRGAAPFEPAAITVPVVVGTGSTSERHHREGATRLAAIIPDAELIEFEGAGHGAHRSHPKEFVDFVRRAVVRSALL
jgi:pimeloyl-ACP methyl ester carboxylesterase